MGVFNQYAGITGLQSLPLTFTPGGGYQGGFIANLGKKYSRLQLSNPDESIVSIYNEDGTAVTKSGDMNISNAVIIFATWGSDSIRTRFTFTAK